jgi:peptidoglycan/LPS O-acetylase OafA/YrhL
MHFRVFEFWRLTAALMIMGWHFLRFAPPGHEEVSAGLYRLMPLMEMFFMISGFLIMLRYGEVLGREAGAYRHFIVRRIARFYPLYLVTLLFFGVVAIAVNMGLVASDDPRRYSPTAFVANLLLVQAWGFTEVLTYNYVAWCMSAEWFCYLLLPVIVLTYRRGGLAGLFALSIASVAALELATAYGIIPFESWLQANTWGAYRAFADFSLGALVAMAMVRSRSTMTSYAPGWLMFALSIAAMATRQDGYVIVALLALSMYLIALAERNNPAGSEWLAPLHPLGRVSMGIYLIHPVMEAIFFSVLWKKLIEGTGMVGFYAFWFVPFLATIVVAMLSDRYFEGKAADLVNRTFGGSSAQRPAPAE